jgi:hypothetical protein
LILFSAWMPIKPMLTGRMERMTLTMPMAMTIGPGAQKSHCLPHGYAGAGSYDREQHPTQAQAVVLY